MKPNVKRLAAVFLALSTSITMADENNWTKSLWGENDEIGAANLMSADLTKEAAGLVKEGKVYSLGLILDRNVPAFPPRSMSVTILQPGQVNNSGLGPTKTTYNDDIYMGWLGIGSQIDGLGHIGVDHVYYNGFQGSQFCPSGRIAQAWYRKGSANRSPRCAFGYGQILWKTNASRMNCVYQGGHYRGCRGARRRDSQR